MVESSTVWLRSRSVLPSQAGRELFADITSGTSSFGIQSELMDLGIIVVSRLRKTVKVSLITRDAAATMLRQCTMFFEGCGCRKPWWRKVELEKVDTAMNILPRCARRRSLEIGFASCVGCLYVCCSKGDMGG